MYIVRDSSLLLAKHAGAVMALGNFDGLHLGHKAVIDKTVSLAKQNRKAAALMTFEPHPRRVFRPDLPTLRLFSFAEKLRRLRDMGIDYVRVIHFTRVFSETSARAFAAGVLARELSVSHVVTGEDFIFGHKREGNTAYLRQMAKETGFGFTACPPVMVEGLRCSSTRIRTLLEQGKVREAATFLGRPYSITGRVCAGDARGRTLGFPTANIVSSGLFMPARGVYAVRAKLGESWVNGVANLGIRPTFGGESLQLEVHFMAWQGDLYGKRLEVEFVDFIRGEQKFEGVDALKAQINKDIVKATTLSTGV